MIHQIVMGQKPVNQKQTFMVVQRLCPCMQEAAKAAVAAAAADKAEAVKACAQLELDTAELRERVARHERTQAYPAHAHRGGQANLSSKLGQDTESSSIIQTQSSNVKGGSHLVLSAQVKPVAELALHVRNWPCHTELTM